MGLWKEISWSYRWQTVVHPAPAPSCWRRHRFQWLSSYTVRELSGGSLLDVQQEKNHDFLKKKRWLIITLSLFPSRKKSKRHVFYTSAHFHCKFKCTVLISKFTRFCRYSELLFSTIKKRVKWCDIISLTVLTFTK